MGKRICIAGAILLALQGLAASAAVERWQTAPPPPPLPAAERSGYAPVNGIRMYFAEYGKGAPILLIPIGMAPSDMWAAQIPILSRHHMVIVADSRGHGRSSRSKAPFSYDLMASDYLELLNYLGLKKVALVGATDGAIIGLTVAMRHPERLTKLFSQGANATLAGTYEKAADPTASSAASVLWKALYRKLSPTPDRYGELHDALEKMWNSEPNYTSAQLAAIRVPTAIAMSDHDEWIKPEHARYLAKTIPGAQLIVLRNVSHYAALQDPQGYAAAVLRFIDGGRSRDPDIAAITRLEAKQGDADLSGDVAYYDRVLTDDYTAGTSAGTWYTKKTFLADLRDRANNKVYRSDIRNLNVRIYGDAAVATYDQTYDAVIGGKRRQRTVINTDVFVKRDGVWRIAAQHTSASN